MSTKSSTRNAVSGTPKADRLGNNTKSATPPKDDSKIIREKRAERYRIQGIARILFGREGHRKKN